jgi:parvulin-like peptidyl-prolyl isomerase
VVPKLRRQLTEDDLINQLKQDISNIAIPEEVKVREYYAARPEKFTIPQQVDVSVILLKVDPWASQSTWQSKREQIVELIGAVENGSDFAELAIQYSEDKSATQGGKLGRVHLGRLVEDAQVAVDALDTGELTQPLPLLEGVAVFKLNERFEPQLKPFADVSDRASRLLMRELQGQAWHTYIESLRNDVEITLFEKNYLPSS